MPTQMSSVRSNRRAATIAVLLLALLSLPGPGAQGQVKPARVIVAGKTFAGVPATRVSGGLIWGPVGPLARMLGAQVAASANGRGLHIITCAGERVTLQAGEALARAGERTVRLEAAPVLAAGHLVAPLPRFLELLGARVRFSPAQSLLVADAVLRALEFRGGEGGLAVCLQTSAPVTGVVRYLEAPTRAYLDLRGLDLGRPEGEVYLGAAGVWRLRWGQSREEVAVSRFVLDLQRQQTVRWVPLANGGRLEVGTLTGEEPLFVPERPRLEEVLLDSEPGQSARLALRFTRPVDFTWELSRRPYCVALKFPDALGEATSRAGPPEAFIREVSVVPSPGDHGLEVRAALGWLMRLEVGADPTAREITVSMKRDSLAGKRIVVDPGHGGKDPGAQFRGLKEKDVNLEVAIELVGLLRAAGALAFLTRDSDVFVPLPERPRLATALNADAFVSIHCNAMERPNLWHGTESYYFTPQSQMLAFVLQESLVRALQRRDNGVRQRQFAVLWRSQQPCALAELMYLDWDAENALLRTAETRRQAAAALFAALRGYFEGFALSESAPAALTLAGPPPESSVPAAEPGVSPPARPQAGEAD